MIAAFFGPLKCLSGEPRHIRPPFSRAEHRTCVQNRLSWPIGRQVYVSSDAAR